MILGKNHQTKASDVKGLNLLSKDWQLVMSSPKEMVEPDSSHGDDEFRVTSEGCYDTEIASNDAFDFPTEEDGIALIQKDAPQTTPVMHNNAAAPPDLVSTDANTARTSTRTTKLTDLPMEILTMISAQLLQNYINTSVPNLARCGYPMGWHFLHTSPRWPVNVRDTTFFAAAQVNRSMRDACRTVFSWKMTPRAASKCASVMGIRMLIEFLRTRRTFRSHHFYRQATKPFFACHECEKNCTAPSACLLHESDVKLQSETKRNSEILGSVIQSEIRLRDRVAKSARFTLAFGDFSE